MGALSITVAREGGASRLVEVACTHGRRDRPFPERHEDTWTVALVRRGTFCYRSSRARPHELRPGWLLFGAPRTNFECSHEHDGGDDCSSLSLDERLLLDASSAAGVACERVFGAGPAIAPLARVSALLERARRRDVALDETAVLVAEALAEHAAGAPLDVPRDPRQHERIYAAMDRIDRLCRQPLSLEALARDSGLSPFHFVRVFRSVTRTTPHQYLIGARLRLAARLLLDTSQPVTDIAYEVGFQDLSNFIRTFRATVGSTPRRFRRR